jgi:hypothetical protein
MNTKNLDVANRVFQEILQAKDSGLDGPERLRLALLAAAILLQDR